MRSGRPRPDRPRVIAHRGASYETAEHTIAAYEQAIAEGADGVECDVRLTADGHLVCVHDRRVERTSDGTGLVSTLRLDDLAELDFGTWKARHRSQPTGEHPDRSKLGILTLQRLIELTLEAGRPIELAIETKHPTRYAGYVEQRLVALLDRYGLAHPRLGSTTPVRIMSFSTLALRRIRRLAPSVRTVLLLDRWPVRFRDGSLPTGVGIAGPGIELVREFPALARRFREQGHEVHVWTVNRDVDLDLCLALDVDVVITDRPGHVLGRLSRGRAADPQGSRPVRPARAVD